MRETVQTASRRVVRFIRIDESSGGGLLSRETIQATEILARELERENRRQAKAGEGARNG